MRIKSLYIKKYKILNDFHVNFEDEINTNVIIGKNGSGKTTLFEAIIHIFRGLSLATSKPELISNYKKNNLQFEIEYFCKGCDISFNNLDDEISFQVNGIDFSLVKSSLRLKGSKQDDFTKNPVFAYLPDHIVTYYSGESHRVTNLFDTYLEHSSKLLKKGIQIPLRQFINIDTFSIRKVLLSLLPFSDTSNKDSLGKILSLDKIESITINFQKPLWHNIAKKNYENQYKKNSEIALEQFNSDFYYAEGEVGQFLDSLIKLSEKKLDENDQIISLIMKPNDVKDNFPFEIYKNSLDFFKMIDHTDHSGLIKDISLKIKLNDSGEIVEFDNMSEGEHQIKLVIALNEIFKNKETIFLFDEPDTYLHPEWQIKLMEQLVDVKNSQVFVNTHSTMALKTIHISNILSIDKGKVQHIRGYKTFAADTDTILNHIQKLEDPISKKLEPEINKIIQSINNNDFNEAYILIDKLEEDNKIDSLSSVISKLRMNIKKKKIFG